jgi:hypothetical protein
MAKTDLEKHKLFTIWAADCAEHVLSVFENDHEDDRPRKAIEAARAWVQGEIKMTEARKFAFAAHAAARNANSFEAMAAARAAGHAASTAHVPGHAKYAASYALKASKDIIFEKEWQIQHIPADIKSITKTDRNKF